MKRFWVLAGVCATLAYADNPKIEVPAPLPDTETSAPVEAPAATAQPYSTTLSDPNDKTWKEYDNRLVKAHFRIKSAWAVMEVKETSQSGTASFTLSRLPLITFAVVCSPMDGSFDAYLSSATLTPIYPNGFKKTRSVFAGRKSVLVRGLTTDGRIDESYFSTDGHSLYQVSFSAPEDGWKEAAPQFNSLKRSFRWLR